MLFTTTSHDGGEGGTTRIKGQSRNTNNLITLLTFTSVCFNYSLKYNAYRLLHLSSEYQTYGGRRIFTGPPGKTCALLTFHVYIRTGVLKIPNMAKKTHNNKLWLLYNEVGILVEPKEEEEEEEEEE